MSSLRDSISPRTRAAYAPHWQLEIGKPVECCIVAGCRKGAARDRLICAAHNLQLWRKTHPEAAQFHRLRSEARKRKKVFTITREEWKQLCALTHYHEGTAAKCGSVKYGLTIDRIKHQEGYSLDNIRVIVNSLNSAKGAQEMECRLKNGKAVKLALDCVSIAEELMTAEQKDQLLERQLENL